jgi:gas vesicle protein
MATKSGGSTLLTFLTGAAVGAAIVYFTAPRAGRDTRNRLTDTMKDQYGRVSHLPTAVSRAATEAGRAARDAFIDEYERGQQGNESGQI